MRVNSPIAPGLLRQMTARRILEVLGRGPASRADLVRETGISAPTVSKAVVSLIAAGLLEEADLTRTLGRPGRQVRLARQSTQVIGVELDVAVGRVLVAGLDGTPVETEAGEPAGPTLFSVPSTYDAMIDRLVEVLRPHVTQDDVNVLGVGISTPGLIDRSTQRVLLSPNLPWLNDAYLARDLEQRLDVDCYLIQEANALCYAERAYGRAQGVSHFALLDGTTGLGLGVMQNDVPIYGHRGLAGEIGHITVDPEGRLCGCGNRGCLETLATDSSLLAAISEAVGRTLSMAEALELSNDPPPAVRAAIDRGATYFSVALAAVVNLFDPGALFVHSRWLSECPGFFETVVEQARQRALGPTIDGCRIERASGTKVQGAVAGVLRRVLDAVGPST